METVEILRNIELFRGLDFQETASVAEVCRSRRYERGELIFAEGSLGDELFIIREGKVAIVAGGRGCNPATLLQVAEPYQVFGELGLVDQDSRATSVSSISGCEILVLARQDLDRVFGSNHRIGEVVMRNIAAIVARRLRKTYLQLIAAESWR